MYTPVAIFGYYTIIITAGLLFLVDFKIYVNTPKAIRQKWPIWAHLPGGAIIAYYKYRKRDNI